MNRRRDDWSPYAVPPLRDAMLAALPREADRARNEATTIRTHDPDGAERFEAAAKDREHLSWALRTADLYWVSGPMSTAALDASHDVPGFTPEGLPSNAGMMLLAEPLPPKDVTEIGGLQLGDHDGNALPDKHLEPVPVDGTVWHRSGATIHVWLLVRTRRLPAPLIPTPIPLTPFFDLTMAIPIEFASMEYFSPTGTSRTSDSLGVLAWLAATWQMMMTPTVTSGREIATGGGGGGGMRRPPSPVRLIDLRPMRHVTTDEPATPSGREYRHRWIVRGHWRQQAVGPKHGQRRLTWIPSYTKGPDEAPLLTTDTVRVWRR